MGLSLNPIKGLDWWQLDDDREVYFYEDNISVEFIRKVFDDDTKYKEVIIEGSLQNRNPGNHYQDLEEDIEITYNDISIYNALRYTVINYHDDNDEWLEYDNDFYEDEYDDYDDDYEEDEIEYDYIILNIFKIIVTE